jgi:glutamine synthetase adenylyltransferase
LLWLDAIRIQARRARTWEKLATTQAVKIHSDRKLTARCARVPGHQAAEFTVKAFSRSAQKKKVWSETANAAIGERGCPLNA